MRRRLVFCLAAATLALLTTGTAQAASQSRTDSKGGGDTAAPAQAERGRTFPFSGLDLALLTAGGGPLLLIGVSLRRRPARSVQAAKEDSLTLA